LKFDETAASISFMLDQTICGRIWLPPSDYAFGASHCAIDGGIGFAAAPSPAKITCAAL
jgi:hypothetical protein